MCCTGNKVIRNLNRVINSQGRIIGNPYVIDIHITGGRKTKEAPNRLY